MIKKAKAIADKIIHKCDTKITYELIFAIYHKL